MDNALFSGLGFAFWGNGFAQLFGSGGGGVLRLGKISTVHNCSGFPFLTNFWIDKRLSQFRF